MIFEMMTKVRRSLGAKNLRDQDLNLTFGSVTDHYERNEESVDHQMSYSHSTTIRKPGGHDGLHIVAQLSEFPRKFRNRIENHT